LGNLLYIRDRSQPQVVTHFFHSPLEEAFRQSQNGGPCQAIAMFWMVAGKVSERASIVGERTFMNVDQVFEKRVTFVCFHHGRNCQTVAF
jgi:hypothetical protein